MQINIINNNVYINNIKLNEKDVIKIKNLKSTKTIIIDKIKIVDNKVIIYSEKDKEYINLSLIDPKNILLVNNKKAKGNTIFLGGTCSGTNWRNYLKSKKYNFYNPLEKNWNEKTFLEEVSQRKTAVYNLYVFTKDIKGYYSIASLIDDTNKCPDKTLLFIDKTDMSEQMKINFKYIEKLALSNGVTIFNSYDEINVFLND